MFYGRKPLEDLEVKALMPSNRLVIMDLLLPGIPVQTTEMFQGIMEVEIFGF